MARTRLISLSRIWYTIVVVFINLILVYFGITQCYSNDSLFWPKNFPTPTIELFIQKICLLLSLVLLFVFIYPALFKIGNFSNDNEKLTIEDLKKTNPSLCYNIWQHSFSLSSTLHLIISFLIMISTTLIHAQQIKAGLKDSGYLRRTDLDLLFDWLPVPTVSIAKRYITTNINSPTLSFSIDCYTRLCVFNFLFASFISILREPYVFWSISKVFSILYSFAIALNVLQWCLMYGALQLLINNIYYNRPDSRYDMRYLLLNQPYTTLFLYLLLEFLIYISSITFYYYGYYRFKSNYKKSLYNRCSYYCPSLIGIIILLLYTACKMPLVHDIFLLYTQTHKYHLLVTFIFEIIHVLSNLFLWIFLTAKLKWNIEYDDKSSVKHFKGLHVENIPIQKQATISLPDLNNSYLSSKEKPYEKIRIYQSEIYYHNRPKNWSLPLNQAPTTIAAFDKDDDIITRSPSYPVNQSNDDNRNNDVQYRSAIKKTLSSRKTLDEQTEAVFLRSNTPPVPPIKTFTKEQIDAARLRAQQIVSQQQKSLEYKQQRHSAALLISQV